MTMIIETDIACIREYLVFLKIRTRFKPFKTSKRMLVHPKDRIPRDRQMWLSIRYHAEIVMRHLYIGQTKIMVEQIEEHKSALISE